MSRLLAIDFDYFFPTPMMSADLTDVMDYDWRTNENLFHIGPIWYDRAAGFLQQGKELPMCTEGYEEFWARFDLSEAGGPFVSDSNLYAGLVLPSSVGLDSDHWDEVWLFDAHHDCGYDEDSVEQLEETGTLGCANWMLAHHERGSEMHVRYPKWRGYPDGSIVEAEKLPAIPVDRQIDDGKPFAGTFDAIAVCRSGAWVPSWCDSQFEKFLEAGPQPYQWIDEFVEREREFDVKLARAQADAWNELYQQAREKQVQEKGPQDVARWGSFLARVQEVIDDPEFTDMNPGISKDI